MCESKQKSFKNIHMRLCSALTVAVVPAEAAWPRGGRVAEPVKCERCSFYCGVVARENRKWQPVTSGETSGERPEMHMSLWLLWCEAQDRTLQAACRKHFSSHS